MAEPKLNVLDDQKLRTQRASLKDQTRVSNAAKLPAFLCVGWGVGAITMGMMANVFNVLILPFATDALGMAAALAGSVVAISKIYDAFADPIIGTISDNLNTSRGRRRPVLLLAAPLCAIAVIFLFFAPDLSAHALVAYYALGTLLLSTAYASWTIPYLAMSAEMTDDYHERSRLISYRVVGGALGVVVGSLCGPSLLVYFGGGRHAYYDMAIVTAGVVLLLGLLSLWMTRSARFSVRTEVQGFSLTRQFRLIIDNRSLRILVICKGCWYYNVAGAQASLVYFIRDVAHRPGTWLSYYFFALTAGMIAAQFAWVRISRIFDKKHTVMSATILYGLACISWIFCDQDESVWLFDFRAVFIGISSGGVMMLLQSMYNDAIASDFLRSGVRREGAFTGVYALVEKLFTAGGVATVGALLGAMHYVSSKTGGVTQPPNALIAMFIGVAAIPAAGAAGCVAALSLYRLDRAALSGVSPRA